MLYKIAICDDEEDFVASLREQVAGVLQNSGLAFKITAFSSGESLLSRINDESASFDMIFLDIFMQDLNGVDTAKAIRQHSDSTAIIFTTSSDQYVFSGYEVHALQYLVKPIDQQLLYTALMYDLKRRMQDRNFVFKSGGMTHQVPFEEIVYLESTLKSVKLVAQSGDYEIYTRISDLEALLPRVSFCRCHRGFIINFKQVGKMNAQSLTTLQGTVIPIGKTYAKAVNRAFLNYIGND
ncbi:MAG: LytTR family DNA-binding domain-containing protein [Syntrophomonas sp.]